MSNKIFITIIAGVCFSSSLCAQQKIKFSSQNYAGITDGEAGTAFQFQTISGFQYKTWFTGIGTGVDSYYETSIPLFLSVSKFLNTPKFPFYLNADAGINFPWSPQESVYSNYGEEFSSSLYWAGGLGYRFGIGKEKQGFLLNFGYSYKHLIQETEYTSPCLFPPCPVSKERYDYRFHRLSVKVGWMF